MPLPTPDQEAINEVEGEIKQEQREDAVAAATATEVAATDTEGGEVATTAPASEAFDPVAYLKEMGIDDIELDFSSFPTIVLNNGKFEKNKQVLGDEFDFLFIDKRKEWVIAGQEDRDSDAVMIYSSDGKTANKDGRPLSEWIAEWEEKEWSIQPLSPNVVVIAKQVGGDDDGEVIQLRLPKTSIHPYNGFLVTLAMARKNPKTVVTTAKVGAKLGSGQKTWSPWRFVIAA